MEKLTAIVLQALMLIMRKKAHKNLPLELWTEVFARLPVKTLLRFRCVCKSWLSIIDDPDFVSMHLAIFNECHETRLLTEECPRDYVKEPKTLSVHQLGNHGSFTKSVERIRSNNLVQSRGGTGTGTGTSWVELVGSVKGLYLLVTKDAGLELWNPSIRESISIPKGPIRPHFSGHNVAFGFSNPNSCNCDDLKVVALRDVPWLVFVRIRSLAVYSLSTKAWRKRGVASLRDVWYFKGKALLTGGALHWLARYSDEVENEVDNAMATHIGSFHLGTDTFTFTPLPCTGLEADGHGGDLVRFPFLVGDQLLAIFEVSPHRGSCMWIMHQHEDGEKATWTPWRSSRCDVPMSAYQFFKRSCFGNLLFIEKAGKLLVLISGTNAKSYDVVTHEIEDVEMCYPHKYVRIVGPHIESLMLHKRFDAWANCKSFTKKDTEVNQY